MTRTDLVSWMEAFLREEEAADRFSGTVAIDHADRVVFQGAYGLAHQGLRVPNTIIGTNAASSAAPRCERLQRISS